MLTVTEAARERLAQMLTGSGTDRAIRICRQHGRLRLRRDMPRTDDTTWNTRGRTVLVLDSQMTEALSRRTLDIRLTDDGPRLRLKRASGPH
jgi:hypothetical protein